MREPGDAAASGPDPSALEVLERRELIEWDGDRYRSTRRFQGAMMRASLRLMAGGDPGTDLRVPIAAALVELLGDELSEAEIARLVAAALPIKASELPGARPSAP